MYKLSKLVKNVSQTNIRSLSCYPKFLFSEDLKMPIIDFKKFLDKSEGWEKECKLTAECLHDTGILVVKDPVKF